MNRRPFDYGRQNNNDNAGRQIGWPRPLRFPRPRPGTGNIVRPSDVRIPPAIVNHHQGNGFANGDRNTPLPTVLGANTRPPKTGLFFVIPGDEQIDFLKVSPSPAIDVAYPVRDYLGQSFSPSYLRATGTETGGNLTLTLTPEDDQAAYVHAFMIQVQQPVLPSAGQVNGECKLTYTGRNRNSFNRGEIVSTNLTEHLVTSEQSFLFQLPADGRKRTIFAVVGEFSSSLGRTVPDFAILRGSTADEHERGVISASLSFTGLGSGSGFISAFTAVTPGTTQYDEIISMIGEGY